LKIITRHTRSIAMALALLLLASACVARVSVASDGTQANGASWDPAMSGNARFMTFSSYASNLVAGDTNGRNDIFVRDHLTGITTRVSVSSTEAQPDHESWDPSISDDGRYVAFRSYASNLVDDDTAESDIFVRDRTLGLTTRISVSPTGGQADGSSYRPVISADGSTVVFESLATNLVADDTNDARDVFVADLATGAITRISMSTAGAEGDLSSYEATVSADGSVVAFASYATNLVSGDTNGRNDIFVHDRSTATTTRVSVSSSGAQTFDILGSNFAALSGDGRLVAFSTRGSELVAGDANAANDIFLRDRDTGTTTLISVESDGTQGIDSIRPAMSADGRYVAFESMANFDIDTNYRADIFLLDRQTGEITLVSVADGGVQVNGTSYRPDVSDNGLFVAFMSSASNLLDGPDTNGFTDVFVRADTD
jgi:Tol biopolymer transport system component